jgi:hypothetical protein
MPTLISRRTVDTDISVSIDQGVSQSEYGTYDLCHYRWYLERVKMLTSVKPEFVLSVGTAFHSGMDWMYKTKGQKIGVPPLEFNKLAKLTPEEEQESYRWHQILWILIKAYRAHYKDDFEQFNILSTEQVLRIGIDGILHCGALDLVIALHSAAAIMDHKTKGMKSSKASAVDEWRTRFQFMLYTLMWNLNYPDQKVRYFIANVIMKPAISQKQGESLQGFLQRFKYDVAERRREYFKREKIPLTKTTLDNFYVGFLKPRIDNMKMLQTVKPGTGPYNALVLQRNSSACNAFGRQCAFYAHCWHGAKLEDMKHLVQRKAKHEHYLEHEA